MGRLNDDDLLKLLTLINPMAFDTSQEGSMLLSHDFFFSCKNKPSRMQNDEHNEMSY